MTSVGPMSDVLTMFQGKPEALAADEHVPPGRRRRRAPPHGRPTTRPQSRGDEERRPSGAMITVTERAAARLQEVLAEQHAPPGQGVKLVPQGPGSVGLIIAAPGEGDEVVRYEDAPVLLVDGQLTDSLAGAELDCREAVVAGQARTEYTLRRPP
jgi:Fe-S cluster assembly iron-binding protein IscA